MTPPAAIAEREAVLSTFLEREQERLARACHELARSFARGGSLIAFGTGSAATDAAHVAVEFMHPVIVGKRALPALAPTNDPTGASTASGLMQGDDIALGITHGARDDVVQEFLAAARRRGLATIALAGGTIPDSLAGGATVDYAFGVPSDDRYVVQEVQETAYHVLWELVHVFFEHPGLLHDSCITCGDTAVEARVVSLRDGTAVIERGGGREEVAVELLDQVEIGDRVLCHAGVALERLGPPEEPAEDSAAGEDPTGFLYPFLGSEEQDLDSVLADARASTLRKGEDVIELRRSIDLEAIAACAHALRARLERGGRLIAFGNGGSSTDAQDATADCLARGWPAVALTNDAATVTAIGNDVGFDKVFARQLIPLARREDAALAISTSGSSANVVAGLEEAHRRGMLTIGLSGYDGGRLAELDWLDHLFVVASDYIPRLQEVHATIYHLLLLELGSR